jgi:ppGpp synthetase/RelA/SpoT-type nucleotidyltranferase
MADRTVQDRLREEYFSLLPHIRRVAEQLEAEIRYHLLPIFRDLRDYEQLVVKARVKECESAIPKLQRHQEGAVFDREYAESYSLTSLKDLAAVRVLVFPHRRLQEVDLVLRRRFPDWRSDPVVENNRELALKYSGYYRTEDRVQAEYQIVPVLTGLFWEVEHSAIYKPSPRLRGVLRSPEMQERSAMVVEALRAFEAEFEGVIERSIDDQRV